MAAACYSVELVGSVRGVLSIAERKDPGMGFNQPRLYQGAQKHTGNYLNRGFPWRALGNMHDIEIFINLKKCTHSYPSKY